MIELWATAPPAGQHPVGHLRDTDDNVSLKIKHPQDLKGNAN